MYTKDLKVLSYYEMDWGGGDYEYWYILANVPSLGYPGFNDVEAFVLNVDSYTLINGLNWLATPITTCLDNNRSILDNFAGGAYPSLVSFKEVDPWCLSLTAPQPAVQIPTVSPSLFGAYIGQQKNSTQTNNAPTPTPGFELDLDFSDGEKKVLPANVDSPVCVQCGRNNKQIQGFNSIMYWCPNCEP